MNGNIFMNDFYTEDFFSIKKKPIYQGVERIRDLEKKTCCNKCAKKKAKRK